MTAVFPMLLVWPLLLPLLQQTHSPASFSLRELTLEVAGQGREAWVWAPDQPVAGKRYPLIFAWHGAGGKALLLREYAQLEAETGSQAIVVYPQGLPTQKPQARSGWMLESESRDVKFFDQLLAVLPKFYAIDRQRVFSFGFSFGAYMSHTLACSRGKQLRGIAAHAGGGPYFSACQGPVAALISHARDDEVVPFARGEESLQHYLQLNRCQGKASSLPGGLLSYGSCSQPLLWWPHARGGHGVPAGFSSLAWQFFSQLN